MTAGGRREHAGRKRLPEHLKRLPRVFYLNESEHQTVKEFVKCLKQEKNGKSGRNI